MAIIIDGKETARKKREEAAARTAALKSRGIVPCLAVVLAGEDPTSVSYVNAKEKALAEAGIWAAIPGRRIYSLPPRESPALLPRIW